MEPVTLAFLLVGGAGLVLLVLALVLGDLLHVGHPDADGPFSLPALTALVGGAGFVGAIVAALVPGDWPAAGRALLAAAVGLVAALPLAYGAVRLSSALFHMRTDPTLTDTDLLGSQGVVVTAIPAAGYGEVRLSVAGQLLKYHARADGPMPAGTPVYVVGTPSATSVEVVSTATDPR
ncbi:hypothetical protein GCM10011594_15190 [Nakamurella endophytica]|uniref:NfeD-like C-terminal domain-containing protein n=2 Tax=Nakamurella endophytica TaxID=1748367 RepID=A0A917ST45_9ACTN|nr:hypothetical protein GCM10011594_15190 [Nakamurella endophytica]